jgi:ParB-like chromosome segregation protein Spo0J
MNRTRAMPSVQTLQLTDIAIDETLQPRVEINWDKVHEYASHMRDGAEFPSIRVYRIKDSGTLVLSDGRHRYEARKFLRLDTIEADVRDGTMRDALRHAVEFNAQHGLAFTRSDQQRAIELYLKDTLLRSMSDRDIARHLHCSPTTVGTVRRRLYSPPDAIGQAATPKVPVAAGDPPVAVQLGQQTQKLQPTTRQSADVQFGHPSADRWAPQNQQAGTAEPPSAEASDADSYLDRVDRLKCVIKDVVATFFANEDLPKDQEADELTVFALSEFIGTKIYDSDPEKEDLLFRAADGGLECSAQLRLVTAFRFFGGRL